MNYFIHQAYLEALKSPLERKCGAILIDGNTIISKGYNTDKRHITSNKKCCLLRT